MQWHLDQRTTRGLSTTLNTAVKAAMKAYRCSKYLQTLIFCISCTLLSAFEQVILDAMLCAHDQQLAGYPATAEEDDAAAADEQLPWWDAPALISFTRIRNAAASSCIAPSSACSQAASASALLQLRTLASPGQCCNVPLHRIQRQVCATLATEKRALAGSRAAVAAWRAALESGAPLSRLYGV